MSVQEELSSAQSNVTILNSQIVHGYVGSATYRGTLDILWSCILTIVACVYTAIHLHVPRKGTSAWKRLGQKLRWAFIAILAPELVLAAAYRERREARRLQDRLNASHFEKARTERNAVQEKAAVDEESGLPIKIPKKFDMRYAFFVDMGGITVSTSGLHDDISKVTLTRHGVALLAAHGHFIEVPDDEIADRSKANPVAKALVCVQVFWFLLQCIVRSKTGYPLALLEVHTMVHVVCALFIYLFWWKKPLDIEVPLQVDSSKFQDLLALMLMANKGANPRRAGLAELSEIEWWGTLPVTSEGPARNENATEKTRLGETQYVQTIERQRNERNLDEGESQVESEHQVDREAEAIPERDQDPVSQSVSRADPITTEFQTTLKVEPGSGFRFGLGLSPKATDSMALSMKDVDRWMECANAIAAIPDICEAERPLRLLYRDENGKDQKSKVLDYYRKVETAVAIGGVTDTISGGSEHYFTGFAERALGWDYTVHGVHAFALIILPVIYGGVHLAARNFTFPSEPEKNLWFGTCIATMAIIPASPFILVIWQVLFIIVVTILSWLICVPRPKYWELGLTQGTIAVNYICIAVYFLCRLYIVVEVFISLRSTALGVYAITPWLQSVPHI